MRIGLSVIFICFWLLLLGCKQNSVEEDMAEYCECIKEQSQKKRRSSRACRLLLKDITANFKDDTSGILMTTGMTAGIEVDEDLT